MVVLGIPSNLDDYFVADGDLAFRLQQAGAIPLYRDGDCLYFKKSRKLRKILKRFELEIEE
jgi:hypothetical protein|nr:MAG TPA: hypothetical protein [Caudoviricetes sp.]